MGQDAGNRLTVSSASARRPYFVGSLTAGTLFGLGDAIAQTQLEKRKGPYDLARTARLAGYGSLIFAPLVTRWLALLNRVQFASRPATIIARVGLDQLIFTPTNLALFFSTLAIAEGGTVEDRKRRLREKYFDTLKANWSVWIPVQAANFSIVPLELRGLTINAFALVWNSYV